MLKKDKTYDVPGLRAGVDIFMALCESVDGLGVAELTNMTGYNKHMVFRCLKTLVSKGWVSEVGEGPKYAASLVAFRYASMPVSRMDVVTAAEEPLRNLWKEIGECVYLGVMHDDMVMYLLHHDGTRNIRLGGRVGEHYWPHAAAAGKVLLAYGEPGQRKRCIERGLIKLTDRTITAQKKFQDDIKSVLKQGYALDDEEYMMGGRCFAVPVFDYTGKVVASIGTTVMTIYYSNDELISGLGVRMKDTARAISTKLGYTGK